MIGNYTARNPWVVSLCSSEDCQQLLQNQNEQAAIQGIELRLDLWPHHNNFESDFQKLNQLVAKRKMLCIITWRAPSQSTAAEAERRSLLRRALLGELHASTPESLWVDIDYQDPALTELYGEWIKAPQETKAKLLLSFHFREDYSPKKIDQLICELPYKPSGFKLILSEDSARPETHCKEICSSLQIKKAKSTIVVGAAGLSNTTTRLLAPIWGSKWSYQRLLNSQGTDAGQVAAALIEERFASQPSSKDASLYAVVGSNVQHSASCQFHNELLKENDSSDFYSLFSTEQPGAILEKANSIGLRGLSVTNPHKAWARQNSKALHADFEDYSSYNTLLFKNKQWYGANTDGPAVFSLLSDAGMTANSIVCILGGGGAALGVAEKLRGEGIAYGLCLRDESKASNIESLGHKVMTTEQAQLADVLINATGQGGSTSTPLSWDLSKFKAVKICLDMNYLASPNCFLDFFKNQSASCIHGIEMFAEQARLQAEIFFDIKVDRKKALELSRQALRTLSLDL